ncbi:imidazolonepropionase [Haloarcula sp. CBA1130]|uniref:imidazolonepropionase n=1 Tax=unclassified Haloarcula TaxID=2624677 RepID=UPI0012450AC0|nr:MULTISPECIES: imidazolonepropionase [unclassified Haloarcula]KAA9396873.1 imidazolonepropionase [Haloarcula sp. CBA1129]KAA9401833.1 imidazolonepropionase [Haloarcula sp. CBA1130]
MTSLDAVVYGAGELVTGPAADGHGLETYEDGAVAIVDGTVAAVGPTPEVTAEYPPESASHAVDADGQAVVPGFVDPHTHALFAGDRSDEFAAKLRGKSYQDILADGGGILRTVRAVRDADAETLLSNLLAHLDTMLAHGTTTVEVKSGYGLDTETELRMLRVIDSADTVHPVDVVPTFMGAHAVPEGWDADDYTAAVIDEQLPAVESQDIAEFCDVFCEEGVFSVSQSRRILEAGAAAGLTPKVHAEELAHIGGTQLAADVGAASADHLLHATDDDIDALVESGVTPVLLPGTAFGLGAEYADAEAFLDAGASVAVATDFNPNCHSHSMGFALSLACVEMGLTPAEALIAGTKHAALALDRTDGLGTLREGAPGDVVVLAAPSHVHIPYQYGTNVVDTVLKDGSVVSTPTHESYDRDMQP